MYELAKNKSPRRAVVGRKFSENSAGVGTIMPSGAQIFRVPSIEQCATGRCQNQPLGTVLEEGRPWWFWLAVGAGVGGLVYVASKSGIFSNPEGEEKELGDFEAAQRAAAISVQAGIPTILWGSPGIGKTSWLEALGKAMDAEVYTVIGSTKDPADIGGMMKLDGSLVPPKWAREIQQRSLKGLKSVLFLDEFSSMAPLVHAALLRVVRDKIAGECNLDPKHKYIDKDGVLNDKEGKYIGETKYFGNAVYVVCAANPRSEGAAAIDLPPPAANRMLHLEWPTPPALTWAMGMLQGFQPPKLDAIPLNWKSMPEAKAVRKDIGAFLSYASEQVLKIPKQSGERGRAWPSPRSWEMAAEALGAARIIGAPRRIEVELLGGSVGLMAAQEFFQWYDGTKKWATDVRGQVSRLLEDAKGFEKIESYNRSDRLFTIGRQLVGAVAEVPNKKNWDKAWGFIDHAEKVASAEGTRFNVAPLAVMASDLLDMINDPEYKDKLKGVKLPDEALLAALDYEGIQVRPRR